MSESKFETGRLVMTNGIAVKCAEDDAFTQWSMQCLERHKQGDWGDMEEEDKQINETALTTPLGRLHSAYTHPDNIALKIWIITEWDRSASTILFPDEY